MPKRWTTSDLDTLYRLYPRHGTTYVARRLKRTEKAVEMKARKEGLIVGFTPGRITLGELAIDAGVASLTARRAAQKAGVMKVWGGVASVPEKWGVEYIEGVRARKAADELAGSWYSLTDAAREIGVHPVTLRRALRGHGSLAHAIEGAIVREGTKGRKYVHPTSVHEARARLRDGTWLTYDQVARLWGCTPNRIRMGLQGKGRLAPLVAKLSTKRAPARGNKGRIRVFHAKDVHRLTNEAHAITNTEHEVAA